MFTSSELEINSGVVYLNSDADVRVDRVHTVLTLEYVGWENGGEKTKGL